MRNTYKMVFINERVSGGHRQYIEKEMHVVVNRLEVDEKRKTKRESANFSLEGR